MTTYTYILKTLVKNEYITLTEVAESMDISEQEAQERLQQLITEGHLTRITANRYAFAENADPAKANKAFRRTFSDVRMG